MFRAFPPFSEIKLSFLPAGVKAVEEINGEKLKNLSIKVPTICSWLMAAKKLCELVS